MLNKIIQYSLNNRVTVLFSALILLTVGSYVTANMEVDIFPDLNAPTVVVMTEASGMAAEEVERLVSFPIETAVNGATDVRRVRSSSTNGFSVVWVEFDWSTNPFVARQIVSEKLAEIGESLPVAANKPTLAPQSSILGEVMIVGLTADRTSLEDLRTLADWTIRPKLLSTGGVAQVTVIGGEIKEYQIQMDPIQMEHYGITLDEVLAASQKISINASGGILNEYGNEYIIRGMVATNDVTEIGNAVVAFRDGGAIRLNDIAQVKVDHKRPLLGKASLNGVSGLLLTITKQPNTNSLDLTAQLDASIEALRKTLPADVHVSNSIFRQARFIEAAISNIKRALAEGALFVVLILFLFLMNYRTTLISLVALPLSLLVAILAMKWMGISINTMSLGGMAIAIGSLVDDAIIDVENVYKRLKENVQKPVEQRISRLKVIYDASTEIRSSIVQATLITMVAFLPLFFLSGMEGRMLKPLGFAFLVSLLASLLVAITLTPVLCSYLLNDKTLTKAQKEPWLSAQIKRIYQKLLLRSMAASKWVLTVVALFFLCSLGLYASLGSSFLPSFNEGSLTINTATMPGISIEESDRIGKEVERILMEIPEIQLVSRKTGRGELDEHALGVNAAEIECPFMLKERSRSEFVQEVRARLSALKGINVEVGQPISHRIDAMLSGSKANIAIKIFGEDLNQLFALGNQIKSVISEVPGIADLNVEQQVERPQLQIVPNRELLALYGITLPEFAEFVDVALGGRVVSEVNEGGKRFDLTLKVGEGLKSTQETMAALLLDAGDGRKVPLSQVASLISTTGPNTINRENVARKIVVSVNCESGDLVGAVRNIQDEIAEKVILPEGYTLQYGGQFESEQQASRILLITSLMALLVIFVLLLQEFKSVRLSLVVMLNLPLALIGAVFALWFTSGIISIPAIIGFIALIGIAARNGILLISRYQHLLEQGFSVKESVLNGSLDRLNPILMTALTSALALIPLALGGELAGNEIQSPLAQVILGGLLSSTLLNGIVLPLVFLLTTKEHSEAPIIPVKHEA